MDEYDSLLKSLFEKEEERPNKGVKVCAGSQQAISKKKKKEKRERERGTAKFGNSKESRKEGGKGKNRKGEAEAESGSQSPGAAGEIKGQDLISVQEKPRGSPRDGNISI